VRIRYRQAAQTDVTRHFRHYLVNRDLPQVALRFKEAVRRTVHEISLHPLIAPPYLARNPDFQNLRPWPVEGFEAIRIYFIVAGEAIRVVRVLHGKQDIGRILEREKDYAE